MMTRRYSELRRLETFEERFRYLALRGDVGAATFGFDRWINQQFYSSREWRQIRHHIIARDHGCDLGIDGYEIYDRIYIHHLNPLTTETFTEDDVWTMLDPENLISCTLQTHNAIHYGDERQLPRQFVERRPGDTKLW